MKGVSVLSKQKWQSGGFDNESKSRGTEDGRLLSLMKEYCGHHQVAECLEELKQYRDLEEQGLLLRLPVAVGDTVYSFSKEKVFSAEVIEIKYICEAENYGKFIRRKITIDGEECGITIIDFFDIEKRYFLTQSEAEEKLRELEGK